MSFEALKKTVGSLASTFAEHIQKPSTIFLAKGSAESNLKVEGAVKGYFANLSIAQKQEVYGKVWELAKMLDPRIEGEKWGEDHVYDNTERLASALHRLGFFGDYNLVSLRCLPFGFGEGGIGSQYFSLGEKLGRDPATGQVGYVNGMGIPSLEHAGKDASTLSDRFVDGNNLHCVYHATHQKTPNGDFLGLGADLLRMKAVEGGSYTKTSYLIAQQWIDFFNAHPALSYLQLVHSEGTVHVNAALRLIKEARPDLLSRLRILAFCPAYFILPEDFSKDLQVISLMKKEDTVINPWGRGTDKIDLSDHIKIVKHTSDHPHNHLSDDYRQIGKPYIDEFMRSGNIY
jgi:hypothetical protein